VILPKKTLPKNLDSNLVNRFAWAGQSAGWMTKEIFGDYISSVFIPHVNELRATLQTPKAPALLWVDGHASRNHPSCMALLATNCITVATFPSHTTHILQPLDKGIFKKFKTSLNKNKPLEFPATLPESRAMMLTLTDRALYDAFNHYNVREAWERTGLYPWDPERVLNNPADVNFLPPPPPPKRKGFNINNTVLTTEAMQLAMNEHATTKNKKKRERERCSDEDSNCSSPPKLPISKSRKSQRAEKIRGSK
jgi:hypothetical protein